MLPARVRAEADPTPAIEATVAADAPDAPGAAVPPPLESADARPDK
ncbi:MAG TPA: hypothetical protein VFU12_10575 [Glycomyces sp.]|nr:hypothetical protein [Glycomyces sp.]